jgi:hypothetical protein
MQRDQGAAALWRKVYSELADDDVRGLLAAVTSRAEAQVLRLSMIYALLDAGSMIKAEHVRAALAVWRYCRLSAKIIFPGGADPDEEKVLDAISQQPGISRAGIYQVLGNHIKKNELVAILARLRDAGKIRVEIIPRAGGGRPTEAWYPCEHCEHCEETPAADDASNPQGVESSQTSQSSHGWQEFDQFSGETPETEEITI